MQTCLENIKKIYASARKFDDQQQYKDIIEAAVFATPDIFTDNITMSPGTSVTIRNPIARKPLHPFTEVLDVKKKTSSIRLGAAKSKRKATRSGSVLWSSIPKRKGLKKPNNGLINIFIIVFYNILRS